MDTHLCSVVVVVVVVVGPVTMLIVGGVIVVPAATHIWILLKLAIVTGMVMYPHFHKIGCKIMV